MKRRGFSNQSSKNIQFDTPVLIRNLHSSIVISTAERLSNVIHTYIDDESSAKCVVLYHWYTVDYRYSVLSTLYLQYTHISHMTLSSNDIINIALLIWNISNYSEQCSVNTSDFIEQFLSWDFLIASSGAARNSRPPFCRKKINFKIMQIVFFKVNKSLNHKSSNLEVLRSQFLVTILQ